MNPFFIFRPAGERCFPSLHFVHQLTNHAFLPGNNEIEVIKRQKERLSLFSEKKTVAPVSLLFTVCCDVWSERKPPDQRWPRFPRERRGTGQSLQGLPVPVQPSLRGLLLGLHLGLHLPGRDQRRGKLRRQLRREVPEDEPEDLDSIPGQLLTVISMLESVKLPFEYQTLLLFLFRSRNSKWQPMRTRSKPCARPGHNHRL